ncbi:hypothetical protein [Streptomyces cinnamoneus]|uniref:Uncharacterized protein n=1 Tax=Streptomyces cinnamoneus TaxID=53446 RepID=A0A918WIY1_STRCJ|nr:hypothetical protein [Streptomyces cinnamoneus]GHC51907.1 hypothetical protein GCM10010507_29900 [Streptomyces cinnamoneus]
MQGAGKQRRAWKRKGAVVTAALALALLVPAGTAAAGNTGPAPAGRAGATRGDDDPARHRLRARVLATLEGTDAARALNRHGDVVLREASGGAGVWNPVTGHRRALQGQGVPMDITDDGRVVGVSGTELAMWAPDGAMTSLGIPPGEERVGVASLGEDGTVLLSASHMVLPPMGGHPRPLTARYRWQARTGFQRIAGPDDGYPRALNDEGLIVGLGPTHGTAWRPDGGTDTYTGSSAEVSRTWLNAVNNSEVAVGGQERPGRRFTATRWTAPDTPQELADLGFGGEARLINDRGWITGSVRTGTEVLDSVPAVWDPRGNVHRLDGMLSLPQGTVLDGIEAVNDRNQMLVLVREASGPRWQTLVVQLD